MVFVIGFIAFVCGVLLGMVATAAFYDAPTVDPVPQMFAEVPPTPAPPPEPAPIRIPEPLPNKYTCVLMREGKTEGVRQLQFLPPTIVRYHGRAANESYHYDGMNEQGHHVFTLKLSAPEGDTETVVSDGR